MRKSQVNNENQENYTLHCAANGHHARRHIYTIYGLISGLHKEIPLFTAQSQVCLYFFGRISSHACFPFTIISLENQRFQLRNTLLRKVRPTRKLTRNRDKIVVQSQNLILKSFVYLFC